MKIVGYMFLLDAFTTFHTILQEHQVLMILQANLSQSDLMIPLKYFGYACSSTKQWQLLFWIITAIQQRPFQEGQAMKSILKLKERLSTGLVLSQVLSLCVLLAPWLLLLYHDTSVINSGNYPSINNSIKSKESHSQRLILNNRAIGYHQLCPSSH